MDEQQAGAAIQQTSNRMKRRGLLAGAGALVAGIVARRAMESQRVAAATGGSVLLGNINAATGTDITIIQNPTSTVTNQVLQSRNFGIGIPTIAPTLAIGLTGIASTT